MDVIKGQVFSGTNVDLSLNNAKKIAKTNSGNLYTCFGSTIGSNTQIQVYKSTDGGKTWVDTLFPQIAGYNQVNPSIAVDSNNNVHVVWSGLDSGNTKAQIKYSKCADNGAWSSWINIQNLTGYDQLYPCIAINSSNTIHVIWQGLDSASTSAYQIKYSKSTNNGSTWSVWKNTQTIAGSQTSPSIFIDSNNIIHLVWSYIQIRYSKSTDDGTTWSNYKEVSSFESNYPQTDPVVAVDKNNTIHVSWHGTVPYELNQLKYSKSTDGGATWSTYKNIINNSLYGSYCPSMSIDSNNNIHIVEGAYEYTASKIYYIKYNYSTDTWNTVDIISRSVTKDTIYPSINIDKDDNVNIVYMDTKAYISFLSFNEVSIYSSNSTGVTTAYNNGKKIAKSSNDNLYACFNNTINSNTQIQVYKSINNGKIWADTKFPQISEYNQTCPSIVIDNNNNIHVMWVGFDADNKTTAQVKYSKSIDNGVTWSAWINIQPIAGQSSPSMTIDSNNNIHVVCANGYKIQYTKSTDTGSTWSVWTNVAYINSSGAYQSNPSIVIDSNNNIHVAWHGIDSSNESYTQIKYSKSTDGGVTWSAWINIQSIFRYNQANPSISVDSNNNVHVVWSGTEYNIANNQIKYSKSTDGGKTWSTYVNIQLIKGYEQTYASIAIDKYDNMYVVWQGLDANSISKSQIKFSKFDKTTSTWSTWINKSCYLSNGYPNIFISSDNDYIGIIYSDGYSVKMINEFILNIVPNIILVNPTRVYNKPIDSKVYANTDMSKVGSTQVQYKLNINGVDMGDFTSLNSDTNINFSIPYSNLVDGNNSIKIFVQDNLGNKSYITTTIYKEPLYRTSVERTIKSIDGGYILNNINNDNDICNIKGKYIGIVTKDNNVFNTNINKLANKIEVR